MANSTPLEIKKVKCVEINSDISTDNNQNVKYEINTQINFKIH